MNLPAAPRAVLAALLCAGLAACGQTAELKPRPGHVLPVAPYGREDRPGANELLAPRPQDAPARSVELRSRSEDRQDDPFDLPPKG
jgi:hypothetical protein